MVRERGAETVGTMITEVAGAWQTGSKGKTETLLNSRSFSHFADYLLTGDTRKPTSQGGGGYASEEAENTTQTRGGNAYFVRAASAALMLLMYEFIPSAV